MGTDISFSLNVWATNEKGHSSCEAVAFAELRFIEYPNNYFDCNVSSGHSGTTHALARIRSIDVGQQWFTFNMP